MTKLKTVRSLPLREQAAEVVETRVTDTEHRSFVNELFERYRDALMRYVAGLLRQRADAEDVLQETYLRLLKGASIDRTPPRARAYMFKIATNLVYDRFRRRDEPSLEAVNAQAQLASAWDTPESMCELASALDRIEQTLLELKPRCRRVFLLRTSEELSYEEIADTLGVSKRTVEREMKHALDVMQRRLGERR